MHLFEIGDRPLLNEGLSVAQVVADVVGQAVAFCWRQNFVIEVRHLIEVILIGRIESVDISREVLFLKLLVFGIALGIHERVGPVVGGTSLVVIEAIGTVSLGRVHDWALGPIHRDLIVVGTQTRSNSSLRENID